MQDYTGQTYNRVTLLSFSHTRRNTYITISGETKVLKDWCTTFGVNCATACNRIKRGYPIYKVFGISEQSVSTNCTPSIGTTVEAVD